MRTTPPSRWTNYKTGLTQLAKDVSSLKNLINVEFKNHDVEVNTGTDANDAGDITALNQVNQGDGTESRDGSQFRMKSLEMRYTMKLDPNDTEDRVGRVIIFLDNDPNGSTPNFSDLLDDTTVPTLSPRNLDNRHRFIFLYDKIFDLCQNGQTSFTDKIYMPLDHKVLFTGATATAANGKKNLLYACFMSDYPNASANDPDYRYHSRIRYIDN